MSLATPRGPLGGPGRAGWFSSPVPDHLTYVEPHPRRIRAIVGGRVVIDTERALLVHRPKHFLAYAFPPDEVDETLPRTAEPDAPGFVCVPWEAVDEWYEEGRRIVSSYPPNPYHRADCRPTTRRLRVEAAGIELVDTEDTVIVFETTLDPCLYVDPVHVRTDLLRRTDTISWCNYKGVATYWAAVVGDTAIDDVAWSYDDPLAESALIAGFLSFDPEKVQVVADLPVGWNEGRPTA